MKEISVLSFLMSLFLVSLVHSQSLNGTYTIGGVSPNYTTLVAAANALNTSGMSGPVTFLIRPGTYTEQFTLNQIVGSSPTNTLLFTSENGDSSSVLIQHQHTGSTLNYTVNLNGTDYVTFSHVSMKALGVGLTPAYEVVFKAIGNCSNVTVKNCRIESSDPSAGSNQYAMFLWGSAGQTDFDSVRILNNYIFKGAGGLFIGGETNGTSEYRFIKGNTFVNQRVGAITISKGRRIVIEENKFLCVTATNTSYTGIFLTGTYENCKIQKNYFDLQGRAKSMLITSNSFVAGEEVLVSNNIIKQSNSYSNLTFQGIAINGLPKLKFLNNTIELTSNQVSTYNACAYLVDIDTLVVLNNILAYNGKGYVYYLTNFAAINANYNNLYKSTTDSLANVNLIVRPTLSALQSNVGIETNSYSIAPNFVGPFNHVPSNPACYDNGIPTIDVTEDFFGTPRSLITPDIGAYEGVPLNVEVGFLNNAFSKYGVCVNDSVGIYVRISNFGLDTITQLNIHYNGTVTPWSGIIYPGLLSDSILITQLFIPNTSVITLPPIWLSSPNGITDTYAQNDSTTATIIPALSGTYTVGNATADFLSLKVAANKLNSVGICAPVVLNVLNGTYDEQVEFNSISGVSAINTITVQSLSQDSSAVTFKYTMSTGSPATSPICKVFNVSHIKFKKVGFSSPLSATAKLFEFSGVCDSINISNCLFQKAAISYNGNVSSVNSGVSIRNNRFIGGPNQIVIKGSPTSLVNDLLIQENYFEGIFPTIGLSIKGAKNFRIHKNDFVGFFSNYMFAVDSCAGPLWMTNNTFNLSNQLYPIKLSNLNGDSLNGVYVVNNMINNSFQVTEINHCNYLYFYHNTLKQQLVLSGTNTNTFVKNNLIQGVKFNFAYDVTGVDIDYNGLIVTGPNPVIVGTLGMTLTTFQSFYQKQYNSSTLPAFFVSATDLHLDNSYNYDNTGTPVPYSTLDFDGDVRSLSTPDIGADEFNMNFTNITNNIRLNKIIKPDTNVCILQDSMILQIVNNSDTIVDSVLVMAQLYGTTIDSFYVTQAMNPNDTIVVFVGQYNFNVNTKYELVFSIKLPNNQVDHYPVDNVKKLDYSYISNCKIYSSPIDDCLTDTKLYIKNFPRHSVLWSTGETTSSIVVNTPGTYVVTVQFNNGCSVTDSFTVN